MKLLFLLLFSVSLFGAVTLINKDAASYKLFIENDKQSAVHTSIGANTTTMACNKGCKIVIKSNKKSIKAKDGETIIIKNGNFSKK
jgi:hypothetical protein